MKEFQGVIYGIAFSPNRSYLVSGSNDWTIGVWDLIKGKRIRILRGH